MENEMLIGFAFLATVMFASIALVAFMGLYLRKAGKESRESLERIEGIAAATFLETRSVEDRMKDVLRFLRINPQQ
jgi:hypothetical protein